MRTPPDTPTHTPLAVLSLLLVAAFATTAAGHAETMVEPDAAATSERWDAVGVSGASSGFTSDAGALRVSLASGDHAASLRATGVAPGRAARITFNLRVSHVPDGATATQSFRLGAGFTGSNGDESDAATYARIAFKATPAGFQLRDAAVARVFSGTQAITWALNDADRTVTYSAPDGTAETLAHGRMDVWVGRTQLIDDAVVTNPNGALSDLKWYWGSGSGETTVDLFAIGPLERDPAEESMLDGAAIAADTPDLAAPTGATPALELYRPSPNPFEGTTRFAYAVAAPSVVEIGVFDVAGRRVRSLARSTQAPGRYEVSWDGRGDDGSPARHGVYFLRANVGTSTHVARVVYLVQ